MRTDVNYTHSKNIGAPVGQDFCGVPIYSMDLFDLEVDQALESQRTVLISAGYSPSTAEILPGEVRCKDGIIRRTTTAEAQGYDEYKQKQQPAMLTGVVGQYLGEEWMYGEHSGDLHQSTPEKLCAWLNAQEKCSFTYDVETEGEDKILRAKDSKGTLLYAFRYVGGFPGTYIGGEEIRPFDPLQTRCGDNSPSRVVQCYDSGNSKCARVSSENAPYRKYENDYMYGSGPMGARRFTPTSHLERLTVGGTALFDELIEAQVEPEITLQQPQTCEWYPDGETLCGKPITHAATVEIAGVCYTCFAEREARDSVVVC